MLNTCSFYAAENKTKLDLSDMTKASFGLKQNLINHYEAARGAGLEALKNLGGEKPEIIFAFSSVKYNQDDVLRGLREVFQDAYIVGGSAAGEIVSGSTIFDGVNVFAIASDAIKFSVGYGIDISKDSFKAGAMAALSVIENNKGVKPTIFIALFDGLTGNGTEIVSGIKSVLGIDFPIIGGSLGDDYLFKKTYGYYNDKVLTDTAIGIGLSGDFTYGFGVNHGWEPVGLRFKVTKSEGILVKEINGKPALYFYEDYFNKNTEDFIKESIARTICGYPLGVEINKGEDFLIREPLFVNKRGEISFTSSIPTGSYIRLMIGDRDKVIQSAKKAAQTALEQLNRQLPKFALVFNSAARNNLLGMRFREENLAVQNAIGLQTPMFGFYTYGEVGPLLGKKGTTAYFHNGALGLLLVGD